ncbi:hypothetical protein BDR05DRAFT_965113 [Suillus weaverae]|nr:hypothetical protein BDR05DRAFT_965113 [Suillus weaverae]
MAWTLICVVWFEQSICIVFEGRQQAIVFCSNGRLLILGSSDWTACNIISSLQFLAISPHSDDNNAGDLSDHLSKLIPPTAAMLACINGSPVVLAL